ncbi:hypothetical protein ACQEVF_59630 [Nonomuraea polychroma]|uniref:hypothetical protein n=1 Tax=Nonomuraea polychroma TaxID=46176 RepID=UPI003D92A20B
MEALALFGDAPEPPLAKSAAKPSAATSAEGPRWSRVKSSAKCGACVARLVEHKGQAPVALTARFRRTTASTDDLFCHEHAQRQRQADGMPAFRAPRA